jgi:hypothetical protein
VNFAAYRELGRGTNEASLGELASTIRLPHAARDLWVTNGGGGPDRAALMRQQLELLAHGELASNPGRVVGARSEHARKEVARTLVDPATGARTEAIIKTPAGGSAREVHAFEVGGELGIAHLMAPTSMRADGTSAMQVVRGRTWFDQKIFDGYGIEHALRGAHFAQRPDASLAEIARGARVDRQLIQSFDKVYQNWDRHSGNGMYDARTGAFHLIDNAGIFTDGPLKSLDWLAPGTRQVTRDQVFVPLLPEAVERWQSVDRSALERGFEAMRSRELASGVEPVPAQAFTEAMGRVDEIIRTGGFRTEGAV